MRIVKVRLCAWHMKYFGKENCMGLEIIDSDNSGPDDKVIVSHGICPECERILKE